MVDNLKKPDKFYFFKNLIARTCYILELPDKKKPNTFWNFSKKPDTWENVQIPKTDKKKPMLKYLDGVLIDNATQSSKTIKRLNFGKIKTWMIFGIPRNYQIDEGIKDKEPKVTKLNDFAWVMSWAHLSTAMTGVEV